MVPRGTLRVIRTASYLVPLNVPQITLSQVACDVPFNGWGSIRNPEGTLKYPLMGFHYAPLGCFEVSLGRVIWVTYYSLYLICMV